MAKVAKKAAQGAQLAGTGLGTVIITAGVIQVIDNIPFGNGADLALGNMVKSISSGGVSGCARFQTIII